MRTEPENPMRKTWTFCCETMKQQLTEYCTQHGYSCPDWVVSLDSEGKIYLKAENACYVLDFCPWCGRENHHRYPVEN